MSRLASHELEPGLWLVEHPLSMMGLELGRRMTVARLPGGELWLHSPANLTSELKQWLDERGPVRFAVSPNRFHHRGIEGYAEAFPGVEILASPGLAPRREDLSFDGEVGDTPDPRWSAAIDQFVFKGAPAFEEVVFCVRQARTLILTDLVVNLPADRPFLTRCYARAAGVYEKFATPRTVRLTFRDRAAARESLERLLDWDFDRVVIGHGEIVEKGGRSAVENAFGWLRET